MLRDKRVLVVGAGNSGCDIAVESAQNAARTFHSTRRGYYYAPKFIFGRPADQVAEFFLKLGGPLALRQAGFKLMLKATVGLPQDYGLPKPDHNILETHPIINSQMLYYVGHGEIAPKPDIAELLGPRVRFTDGSVEDIDIIVYATGFNITFPFIDNAHLAWQDGRPRLYLNVMHPRHDNLFVVGLIQPDSGQFGLVDYQAQLVAAYIAGLRAGKPGAAALRRAKAGRLPALSSGIKYVDSTRHYVEVEHFGYRKMLRQRIARLEAV
jgi:cation diffusion facilitator CzcD-associated flavoprotein CzcO